MKRNKRNGKSGETLVETIVSFAIVMLILVTITAVVQLAARMNAIATERAAALEAACTAVEHDQPTGTTVQSSLLLTLPDGTEVTFPIDVYSTDLLTYFSAHAGG